MENLERDYFRFRKEYIEAIARMSDEAKRRKLTFAVLHYGLNGELPDFDADDYDLKSVWALIQFRMDRDLKQYLNGKKGGAPKGNQNARKEKL